MTSPDPTSAFDAQLASVRSQMAGFESRWRAWAELLPRIKVCIRHAQERPILTEFSLEQSWKRKEFVIFYKYCPECKKINKRKV